MSTRRTRTTSSPDPAAAGAAAPRRTAGQVLRVLTGVEEGLLARVRTERARYTALAAVMLCTATIGGCSAYFGLGEILGTVEPWFLGVAAGWGVFVLCMDCWLVSSSAGTRWRTRASVLGPRLVVACFVGFLIAEPIVLRIFEPSVLTSVRQERQDTLDTLRKGLLECNRSPLEAEAAQPAAIDCSKLLLGINGAVGADAAEVAGLRKQADDLTRQIAADQSALEALRRTVNEECNGTSGQGLTGRAGNGPACRYDQQAVEHFTATHPTAQQQLDLAELNHRITEASAGQVGTEEEFQRLRADRIAERLAKEDAPEDPVGLGDRFDALFGLAAQSGFIGAATWLVRIFFVLIDCMPVLVKFFSGATAYDRLVDIEVASAEKTFTEETRTREAVAEERLRTELHEVRAVAERRRMEIDLETRRHTDEQQARQRQAIDDLWERKLGGRRVTPFAADTPGPAAAPDAPPRPSAHPPVSAAPTPAPVHPSAAGPGIPDEDALERLFREKLARKRSARVASAAPEAAGAVNPVPWSLLKPSAVSPHRAGLNGHEVRPV